MTRLPGAAALFVAANLLHTADHVRTGLDRLTPEILTAGTLLSIAAAVVLAVAAAREVARPAMA